jgi:hypothetical protein
MIKNYKALTGAKDGGVPSVQAEQGDLWIEPHTSHLNQTIEDWHMQHVTLSGAKGLAV